MRANDTARAPGSTTRVLLADTRQVLRAGYSRHLGAVAGVTVVGEVSDLAQLGLVIDQVEHDVVMAGISLFTPLWQESSAHSRHIGMRCPLLVAIPEIHDGYLAMGVRMGARGYVLEDASPEELAQALRCVAEQRDGWSSEARRRVLRWQEEVEQPWWSLTTRERDVLRMLARGMSNAAIAEALTVTPKTVEHHVGRILSKLGLSSRVQAVVWYLQEFPPQLRGKRKP